MPLTIRSALSLCAISFALSHGAIAQELPQHQDDPIVVPGSPGNSSTEESPETSAAPEPTTTLLAGLGGLAQISLPVAEIDGLPLGLSLVGPRGPDRQILNLARSLAPSLAPPPAAPGR